MPTMTHSVVDPIGNQPAEVEAIRVRLVSGAASPIVYRTSDGAQVRYDEWLTLAAGASSWSVSLIDQASLRPLGSYYEVEQRLVIPGTSERQVSTLAFTVPSGAGPFRVVDTLLASPAGATPQPASGLVDRQVFTASGTWTKPAGAKVVQVECVAGGAGGGSGARHASGTSSSGGAGGGSGAYSSIVLAAASLGATEPVTVGASGAGGAAVTVNSTAGNAGSAGGASQFGSPPKVRANTPASMAAGGQLSASSTGGTAGRGSVMGGGSGGAGNNGGTGAPGNGHASSAGAPGGGGGGISTGAAAFSGGAGGQCLFTGDTASVAGTGGGGPGSSGSAVVDAAAGGGGGSGGGSSVTGAGGAGGNAGTYGSGGGGGGSALNGFASGAGGAGSPGIVVITSW
ncbi:hypothetical protein [Actinomycetospora aeridis]|uniref:Uncharacterized protein n=1 Tax=Actinomycetospora aeridis TaxID=3129231 RepID=A0ABU8N192_9PSEU